MRPAQHSYGCLLSGQVGLALAEVHLFMLLTNFRELSLAVGSEELDKAGGGRKGKRRQFLPH